MSSKGFRVTRVNSFGNHIPIYANKLQKLVYKRIFNIIDLNNSTTNQSSSTTKAEGSRELLIQLMSSGGKKQSILDN